MAHIFCLIGDSNLRRHMNPTNCRDRPPMLTSQVLLCQRQEILSQSLRSIKRETSVCVLACITNFLTSSDDVSSTINHRVDPVLVDFFKCLDAECQANPDRKYLVCPPMYRRLPLWYRDGLSQVLSRFSFASKNCQQPNFGLLPSFPSPAFEADGVHLTAYSGMEYVLHLFDSCQHLLESLSAPAAVRECLALESTRLLEDRVMALEQDHLRLSTHVDLKDAIYAESEDFRSNERMENCFMVSGLNPIQGRLSGKEWQERAQSNVQVIIRALLGESRRISVVRNATGMSPNAIVTYNVEMEETSDAALIRSKFGRFFSGGKDARPPNLSQISIQNSVTKGTRIRISILKLIAKKYESSNPEGKAHVIGYTSRPTLRITPPPTAKDKRARSYTYIEAIKKFPIVFSEDEIAAITKRAHASFPHQLRSTFGVLSDDFPGLGARPARSKRAASPTTSTSGSTERRLRVDQESEVDLE